MNQASWAGGCPAGRVWQVSWRGELEKEGDLGFFRISRQKWGLSFYPVSTGIPDGRPEICGVPGGSETRVCRSQASSSRTLCIWPAAALLSLSLPRENLSSSSPHGKGGVERDSSTVSKLSGPCCCLLKEGRWLKSAHINRAMGLCILAQEELQHRITWHVKGKYRKQIYSGVRLKERGEMCQGVPSSLVSSYDQTDPIVLGTANTMQRSEFTDAHALHLHW